MKSIFVILFTLLCLPAFSQDSKISLGFYLEVPYRINRITANNIFFTDVNYENKPGFSCGVLLNYQITDRFSIRPKIGANIEPQELSFSDESTVRTFKEEESFLTAGIYGITKISNKTPLNVVIGAKNFYKPFNAEPDELNLKKFDFAGEIGLTYTIQLEHFRMAPEVTYSRGLVNVSGNKNIYQQALDSYYRDRINLSVSFF